MGRVLGLRFLLLCFFASWPAHAIGAAAGFGDIIGVPGGAREITVQRNYTAPTDNLTKVANSFRIQTYSLSTLVIFNGGLVLTKPVCISIYYDSYSGRAYSNFLSQAYTVHGNQFVFNDPEGIGKPRQASLRISLFEPGSGPCGPRVVGTGFDIPDTLRVNLDALYDVNVRPIQVTRVQDCPMLTSADVVARWFSPDNQQHEASFRFGANKVALVPGSQWNAQAVSASQNFHMPNVGLYGFYIPPAPSNVNLIPAPLAAGTPMATQEMRFQMNEPNRHCTAGVQYTIDRKIRRYVDPTSPAAVLVPGVGDIAR